MNSNAIWRVYIQVEAVLRAVPLVISCGPTHSTYHLTLYYPDRSRHGLHFMRSLLLLTTCVAISMAAAIGEGSNDVITLENSFTDKNGTEISQTTEVDVGCNLLTSVAEYGDDSRTTTINDYKGGLSLVTFSNVDVCYLRNLSATEKRQATSCRYGSMKVSSGKETSKDEEMHFESLEVVSIDQLSPTFKEQCWGKRVILLKETTGTPTSNDVRSKRSCQGLTIYSYKCNCYTKCYPCTRYCYICYAPLPLGFC